MPKSQHSMESSKTESTPNNKMVQYESGERQMLYQAHRARVLNAKSLINSQPPQRKEQEDPDKLPFDEMLTKLKVNLQSRMHSRTFTKSPELVQHKALTTSHENQQEKLDEPLQSKPLTSTRRRAFRSKAKRQEQQQQQQQNHQLKSQNVRYSGIKTQSAVYMPAHHNYKVPSPLSPKNGNDIYDIPEYVLNRYSNLTEPSNTAMVRKLLRPKIFLDLEIEDVRPLGRVVIQLFTEACPDIVLEFVRACYGKTKDRFAITRVFPPMWLECELGLDDRHTLAMPNLEHDCGVLDHGIGDGILSFPSRYVRGSKRRSLSFNISFQPLDVLNGKRIAFGKVRRGRWILDSIQDCNLKNGKPLNSIVVKACGISS